MVGPCNFKVIRLEKRSLGWWERNGFRAKAAGLGENLSRNLEEILRPSLF